MNEAIDIFCNILVYYSTIVGGASIVVTGLRKIAEVTPTKKDDELLAKAQKFLDAAIKVGDAIALTPREKRYEQELSQRSH